MERQRALELIQKHVTTKNLIKHLLATEAVMRSLACHFGEDPLAWGMAGLVHDLDYDLTKDDFSQHGKLGAEILSEEGIDEDILHAVRAHSGNVEAQTRLAKALYCTDPLTGFLVACALISHSRKLKDVDVPFVLNRFREKRFAAGANRDIIMKCGDIGLSLEEFIEIGLKAMQETADDLGL
ncbi:HD domain-containing protein [bacterium]|nr:HD domain-containing protein [bacterium]